MVQGKLSPVIDADLPPIEEGRVLPEFRGGVFVWNGNPVPDCVWRAEKEAGKVPYKIGGAL